MRVIAGIYKSRKLKTLKGENTRPTTSKNKENLFNIIGPYFDGGVVLDLFAGSGSLGIEAISRGMEEGYFIENSYPAFQVIQENIALLKLENSTVNKIDAFKALNNFRKSNIIFDLVFLDPPYKKGLAKRALDMLVDLQLLSKNAIVIVEEDKSVVFEKEYKQLVLLKHVVYSTSSLYIYENQGEI